MTDKERKQIPIFSGVLAYFPDAIKEVAKCSMQGNIQHHPDKPLHWDRDKSNNHLESLTRHLTDLASGEEFDTDGIRHLSKIAWRALAQLQIEIEKDKNVGFISKKNILQPK